MTAVEEELRVAVVGAGPAGIYTAAALVDQTEVPVAVDIFDRLPTPFGLLRYGVAPDHLKMKALGITLQRTLDNEHVRFFGNITVGTDITVAELLGDYHAVVYSYGAATDRKLGIPGEDLRGSLSAREFVNWYCDDPDASVAGFDLTARSAVVIGLGNVALDAARILIRDPEELSPTDVSDEVLDCLRRSSITEVHIVGRRGPEHAKFTTKELRELGELSGVDVVLDPAAMENVGEPEDTVVRRNLEVFRGWSQRSLTGAPRRIYLHFHSTPVAVLGTDSVEGLRVEHPDGSTEEIGAQLVLRSAGYRGTALDGLPFDEQSGTLAVVDHRVQRADGEWGEYAAGWIKRGATGVIGTNRSDATATVRVILGDADALRARDVAPGTALGLAVTRGAHPVGLDGWAAIDAAEVALGAERGSARIKLSRWEKLLAASGVLVVGHVEDVDGAGEDQPDG
ncbi:MAG TPA: FAD-dependent oxidoreductase [Mycobacteriales bacterium]|nr:FAD-dependent oxidoreductase [Mycobacteriales bacterium]